MGVRYEIKFSEVEKVSNCSELNTGIENLIVFLRLNETYGHLNNQKFKLFIIKKKLNHGENLIKNNT
jgi:hypothetical protein